MSMRERKIPIGALERIDEMCSQFEQQWQTDKPPSIESVIKGEIESIERDALLAELVVLDIDYRRRRGESPKAADYIERFPNDASVINEALDDGRKRTGPFQPPTLDSLGQLFPALQILELIGVGGMGAVYKVRQKGLDRVVALKILPEEFVHDAKFALRFTREARTLARLNHPNIVSVYEFGNVQDTYYFLMEYVDGSTLREVVQARQLAPEHAIAIVPQLCDALQYAHDKGVIHRDIKPENILMSVEGKVQVADFGLSRILGKDNQGDTLTGTHQVMGTPRYMAPEQFEGTHSVDHRADIYSLGVVIYEMLTGELPIGRFEAPSQKVSIDVRLDEVVFRTLEKEPKRRYQHASEIKSDVHTITSTDNPALAHTIARDVDYQASDHPSGHHAEIDPSQSAPPDHFERTADLQQQELAGRLLLTRRQLISRVEQSLRPLFRWQILQVLIGIAIILLGVQCWVLNTSVPHRLVCGLILHVYGIVVISQAALVCTRLNRIEYSKPVDEIREKLKHVRAAYLRAGLIMGFVWWLMWIPVSVAFGFEAVLHPNSLIVSLAIGFIGLVVSVWLHRRAIASDTISADSWRNATSGESLSSAFIALDEMDKAGIR